MRYTGTRSTKRYLIFFLFSIFKFLSNWRKLIKSNRLFSGLSGRTAKREIKMMLLFFFYWPFNDIRSISFSWYRFVWARVDCVFFRNQTSNNNKKSNKGERRAKKKRERMERIFDIRLNILSTKFFTELKKIILFFDTFFIEPTRINWRYYK